MKSSHFSFLKTLLTTLLALATSTEIAAQPDNGSAVSAKGSPAATNTKTTAEPVDRIGIRIINRKPVPPAPPRPRTRPDKPDTRAPVRKVFTNVMPPPGVVAAKKLPAEPIGQAAGPLGLTRLKSIINPAKFDVEPLELPAGAAGLRKEQQNGIPYLVLDGNRRWSRPLRGSPKDVVFVSFVVNAGLGTSIDVGGARLYVSASHRNGYADMQVAAINANGAAERRPLRYRVPLETFGGRLLAMLPVFTVRLDPAAGVWDVYSGVRPISRGLPLVVDTDGKKGGREFAIQAGETGAWICGAVISEENPLFADIDLNGVEDNREGEKKVTRLAGTSTAAERRRPPASPPTVLRFPRPMPDRFATAAPAPKK